MAAVSGPVYSYPPPPAAPASKRPRWWLIGAAGVWLVFLVGLSVWSVRNDPPTVAEQRDLGRAVPELQAAVGSLLAVAQGTDRAVLAGELEITGGCRLTTAWDGATAEREVSVYVREGQARTVLEQIAAGLPRHYRAGVSAGRGGTRLNLYADAGDFIGIEAKAQAGDRVLRLRAFTGCRPAGDPVATPPPGQPARPAILTELAGVLGVRDRDGDPVPCGEGRIARVHRAGGGSAPDDLGSALRDIAGRGTVVLAERTEVAFRSGTDSVVVTVDGTGSSVVVTGDCQ